MRKFRSVRRIADGFLKKYELIYDADGREVKWEMISFNELKTEKDLASTVTSAEIIARFENGDWLLCREFRYAVNGYVWQFPTGMLEKGETPVQAAVRELWEETGLEAVRCEGTLPPCCYSVGLTDQIIVPVMLTVQGKMRPCDGACEEIVPCRMTAEEVRKLMNDPRERMTETCLMYLAGALGAG